MQRHAVDSSAIAAVGYDAATGTLEVEFSHGAVYQYFDIPEDMYVELMQASSKGTYLYDHIRNAFLYSRVG